MQNLNKRIITVSLILAGLGTVSARAGEDGGKRRNIALQETAQRNCLWNGSTSEAGLAFAPYGIFNTLTLDYDGKYGAFRRNGDGKSSSGVSLNTSGAAYIGKFLARGGFSFKDTFDKDALYNVLLYEIEDNMPFYPVDDKSSGWNRQEYRLNAGLSSPVLWNRVSFGLSIDYSAKVGAKQLDPRGETFKYGVTVRPSVAVRLAEKSILGVSGSYSDSFERSKVSNNNNWVNPAVWEHRGLGESTQGRVGGNDGMKTHTYRSDRYGAAIQYSYGDIVFVEAGYERRTTSGIENPGLPKRLGSIKEDGVNLDAAWIFGRDKSNKLSLDAGFSLTKGLEYVQKLNTTAYQQEWTLISTNEMSSFTQANAKLGYDHLFGASDQRGYSWKVGAEVSFDLLQESYLSPASTLDAMRVYGGLLADKNFKFRRGSSLIIGLHAGYAAGFGAGYDARGTGTHETPKAMLCDQADYLNASHLRAGGRIDWTFAQSRRVSWTLGAKASYLRAFSLGKDRTVCSASIGILF